MKNVGKTTERVEIRYGYYVKVRSKPKMAVNPSPLFEEACRLAGVRMTRRQQIRFERKIRPRGAAWKCRVDALREMAQKSGMEVLS